MTPRAPAPGVVRAKTVQKSASGALEIQHSRRSAARRRARRRRPAGATKPPVARPVGAARSCADLRLARHPRPVARPGSSADGPPVAGGGSPRPVCRAVRAVGLGQLGLPGVPGPGLPGGGARRFVPSTPRGARGRSAARLGCAPPSAGLLRAGRRTAGHRSARSSAGGQIGPRRPPVPPAGRECRRRPSPASGSLRAKAATAGAVAHPGEPAGALGPRCRGGHGGGAPRPWRARRSRPPVQAWARDSRIRHRSSAPEVNRRGSRPRAPSSAIRARLTRPGSPLSARATQPFLGGEGAQLARTR